MKFEIFILPQAERDLVDTVDWLQAKSIKGATNWLNVWEQTLQWLAEAGDCCGKAPEAENAASSILQHIFRTRMGNPYRVLFTIQGERLYVIHVRGFGRNTLDEVDLSSLPDTPGS